MVTPTRGIGTQCVEVSDVRQGVVASGFNATVKSRHANKMVRGVGVVLVARRVRVTENLFGTAVCDPRLYGGVRGRRP